MFGNKSNPSKVYAYRAKPPKGENAVLIRDQIDRGWRYRNDLVALELERRAAVEEAVQEHYPTLRHIEALLEDRKREIEKNREAVKQSNQKSRSRDPDPARRARTRELRAERKTLYEERRWLRRRAFGWEGNDHHPAIPADPELRKALDAIDADHKERVKRLRNNSGLHWGSSGALDLSLQGIRSGAPPRFVRRADWNGQVAAQLQGGVSWDDLLAGNGQAYVEPEPLPPGAKPGGRRSKRPYYRLHIRVGSEGREPIYATVRFTLHRPVPKDGRIKWVRLVRQRQGTDERWNVQFIVSRENWAHQDTHTAEGVAAVNLGYRMLNDGSLRVAFIVDEQGSLEELRIPPQQLDRWRKARSLQAIRSREFDVARAALSRWLSEIADVPEWLREATATLDRWRSQPRLASVVRRWGDARFPGDESIYEKMEAWRKQDKHLCDWEAAERAGFRRWRQDAYRRFTAWLRWTYERVVVDDTDWAAMRRREPAEEAEEPERLNRRAQAGIASPGGLRTTIKQGHPNVLVESARGITQTCWTCGADPHPEWDSASEIMYRCAAGHQMDQDEQAARNLLARALERLVAG